MSDIGSALGISAATLPSPPRNAGASSFFSRYADGYQAAGFIVGFGAVIKVASIIVGALVVIVSFIASVNEPERSAVTLGIGVLMGALIGFGGFITGIVVSAQGQMLKALLDTAVNTSPFLANPERTKIMGL
jgi:hypothetical protein